MTQKTFKDFVADKYPNDTAVKENYSESDLIDFYPDLWDAFSGGFNSKQEHLLSHVKSVGDVHEYLETVVQEDQSIADIKYSIELLLSRIKEIEKMTELRKQFEMLPEIETHLNHGNVFWSDENKTYASEFQSLHVVACYVNGAWYAFQEQQKKIDSLLDHVCGSFEDFK